MDATGSENFVDFKCFRNISDCCYLLHSFVICFLKLIKFYLYENKWCVSYGAQYIYFVIYVNWAATIIRAYTSYATPTELYT